MKRSFTLPNSKSGFTRQVQLILFILLLLLLFSGRSAFAQVVTSLSPSCKTVGDDPTLLILGRDFNGNISVTLNNSPVPYQVLNNSTTIRITVPNNLMSVPGIVTVKVSKGSTSDTGELTIAPQPTAGAISGAATICAGTQSITYSVSPTSGLIYSWTVPQGATIVSGASTNQIVVNFSPSAVSGNVTVKATNACNTSGNTSSLPITVNPIPTAPTISSVERCGAGPVTLSVSNPTAGYTYNWYNSSGNLIYIGTNYSIANLTSNSTFTVSAINTFGCVSATRTSVTATINTVPVINITNPAPVCSPSTVDLTAAAVKAGSTANLTYTYWTNADATTALSNANAVSVSGTYYIKGTTAAGCFDIKPVQVTVNPKPTVVVSDPDAVCSPATVNLTAASVTTGSTAGLTYTYWTNAQGTSALNNPNSVAVSGTYYIKGTNPQGCFDIKPVTVTVNPTPVVTIVNPAPVCSPSTVNLTAAAVKAGSTAGLTFTYWTDAQATVPLNNAVSVNTSGTYYIKGTTSAGCFAIEPVQVTVNPKPTVVITNPAAVCSPATVNLTAASVTSGSTAGLTYTYWTNAAATTPLSNPGAVATSGTYYIKGETAAGCSDIKPVVVTVNTTPTVVINNPSPVCAGTTVNLKAAAVTTGSTANLTYTYWTNAAATTALANPDAVTTSGTYYIKGATISGCFDIKPVTVTVNPIPGLPTVSDVQRCGSGTVTLSGTPGASNSTLRWYSAETGGTPLVTATSYTPNISLGETIFYVSTYTSATGCESARIAVKATAKELPDVTITPTGPTGFCVGNSVVLEAKADASYSYQWFRNGVAISGATESSYEVTQVGTNTFYAVITKEGCPVTSDEVSVTVSERPNSAAITIVGPTTFCSGGSARLQAPSGIGYEYLWEVKLPNGTFEPAPVQTGESNTAREFVAKTSGIYRVIVTKITIDPETGNEIKCDKLSDEVTITVLPQPTASITSQDESVCEAPAGPTTFTVSGKYSGGTGVWSATNGFTISGLTESTVNGVTTSTITVTAPANVSNEQSSSVTLTTSNASASCNPANDNVTLTVRPLPVATITTSGATTFCEGGSVVLTASAGTSYLWSNNATTQSITVSTSGSYSVTVTNSSGCTSTSAATAVTVNPLPTATITASGNLTFCEGGEVALSAPQAPAGSTYAYQWLNGTTEITTDGNGQTYIAKTSGDYKVRVTDTSKTPSCSVTTQTATIVTVNTLPIVAISANGAPTTFCQGGSVTLAATVTPPSPVNSGTYSYQWYNASGALSGATNPSYTASTAGNYYVIVTNSAGACTSAKSNEIAVKVNTTPAVAITANGNPTTFCQGGSVTLAATVTPPSPVNSGTYSYQWYNASGAVTGATNSSYIAASSGNYYVIVTNSAGTCASGSSNTIGVTVNPIPVLNAPFTASVCSGQTFTYVPASTPSGASFSWVRTMPSGITGTGTATGNGTISQGLTNTTANPLTVTYTYTVTANNCSSQQAITVTVNPSPQLSSSLTLATCSGTNFTYTAASATNGATFGWTRTMPTGITSSSPASGSGNLNQTLVNTTANPLQVTYSYITSANGCSGPAQNVVVTVNPSPKLSTPLTATICSNTAFVYNPSSLTTNATFTWTRASVTGISNPAVTVAQNGGINETLVNTTPNPVQVIYRIITSANGCAGTTESLVLTVNPNSVSFTGITNGATYYTGEGDKTLVATPSGGTFSGPGVSGNKFSPCAAGAGNHTITYTYTTGAGCTSTASMVVKVQQSKYTVVVTATPFPVCRGQNTDYTAQIYRDIERVVYPYMTNALGQPLNAQGQVVGDSEEPAPNPEYIANYVPANTPAIIKQHAYRYFEAKVILGPNGTKVNEADGQDTKVNQFTYRWTRSKSDGSSIGDDARTRGFAGLSATDWVGVWVSPKNAGTICGDGINLLSSRIYFSEPQGYTMTISSVPAWCYNPNDQSNVTFTATLGSLVGGWETANVTAKWYLKRSGVADILLGTTTGVGGTAISLTKPRSMFQNGDQVYLQFTSDIDIVTNSKCDADPETSQAITIRIDQPATITTNLTAIPAQCESSSVTLTVAATGTNLQYAWYKVGSSTPLANTAGKYSGATTNALNISNLSPSDVGKYYVVISNGSVNGTPSPCAISVTSNQVDLAINALTRVTTSPTSQTVCAGSGVTFNAAATGTNVTYQWYKGTAPNLTKLDGKTGSSLDLASTTIDDAGNYTVVMTGTCGVETRTVQLTINQPVQASPLIAASTYCENDNVTMSVNATGTNVQYKWFKDGVAIGYTNSTLTITSAKPANNGNYTVEVTGTCTSTPVTVSLGNLNVRPMNLSPDGEITATHLDGRPITAQDPVKLNETAVFTVRNDYKDNGDDVLYVWYVGNDATGEPWTEVQRSSSNRYERVALDDKPYDVKVSIIGRNGNNCYADLDIDVFLAGTITPLPVELLYFKAEKNNKEVVLKWATASERDNEGFEVQVSQDGKTYKQLQFVPSKNGSSSIKQTYEFVDKENGKYGTRYYRLKQLDTNGEFAYYGPQMVTFGEVSNKVLVYPNPFEREVKLDVDAEKDGVMEVTLTNMMGKQLLVKAIAVAKGQSTATLDLGENLAPGVYIITTRLNGQTFNTKLLKR